MNKIKAQNKDHLKQLIQQEMIKSRNECDLNHIDISQITDMSALFLGSKFNGDISQWNTSAVQDMESMFYQSQFNQDISNWDVSKVEDMYGMFSDSQFNSDISKWNVCSVKDMDYMFTRSIFNQDISNWNICNVEKMKSIFQHYKKQTPYWAEYATKEDRIKAYNKYILEKTLNCLSLEKSIFPVKTKI